ncbi:hypothetical protein V500_03310 [Pseudogymnoascus sp. VKM F-4518 (FW-2643)]|nr:hypothetical protein V500_03310 [Pseudogymnoascus sp. VKM F-4518 (FW-2643)]
MKGHGSIFSLAVTFWSVVAKAQDAKSLELPFTDAFTHGEVNVEIGSPGRQYKLLFDPGSSNTWVGAQKKYEETSTSTKTGDAVAVAYGSGQLSGEEYMDSLTLMGVSINQSIGAATSSKGFDTVDGILGLGPTSLTNGTLIPNSNEEIPTIIDNLVNQGHVEGSIITINNQSIIFGAPPASADGATYVPITRTAPASNFWGVDASFAYGAKTVSPPTSGIVDHGSTLTLLTSSSFSNFLTETGAKADLTTGLPMLASCAGLDPIILSLGQENITIPVEQYRWPAAQRAWNPVQTVIIHHGGEGRQCQLYPWFQYVEALRRCSRWRQL